MEPPLASEASRDGTFNSSTADVDRHILSGFAVIALLLGTVGVWAATAQISGAVLAPGHIVVDTNVKKVQHLSGGVVALINVREGDAVKGGDLLVRLDETVTRANLQVITRQLDEIAVRQTRLKAELEGKQVLAFDDAILARQDEAHVADIMATETALFQSRRSGREGLKAQLDERIAQLRQEETGLRAQLKAKVREFELAKLELAGLAKLEGQHLVAMTKITAARKSVAAVEGDLGQIESRIAQVGGKIAETKLQSLQLDQDMKSEVGNDLREQQAKTAELSERRIAAEDQLKRIDIRSPQAGIVHQLAIHTVGGVVSPGEPLMMIVPNAERLIIEARVAPQDIDQVRVGNRADVRLTAFNQRTTPEFEAVVSRLSPDLTTEPSSNSSGGISYYVARLTLTPTAKPELDALTLLPGMPAEVHIKTGDRTAMSYLIKPLIDQFSRAFRER